MGGHNPKALCPLGEGTMISKLLSSVKDFSSNKPILVVGYKSEEVKLALGDKFFYAYQSEQKGTGHAVMSARQQILDSQGDIVIILNADQPFISKETLENFVSIIREKDTKFVIATSHIQDNNLFDNYFYYLGRINRNNHGIIESIIESKDASDEELKIREISPAFFCLDKTWLLDKLDQIENQNAQGEYYITDLISIAFNEGLTVESIQVDEREALGANSYEQLKLLEKYLD